MQYIVGKVQVAAATMVHERCPNLRLRTTILLEDRIDMRSDWQGIYV